MASRLHLLFVVDAPANADAWLVACRQAGLPLEAWCVCSLERVDWCAPAGPYDLALVEAAPDARATRRALGALHRAHPQLPILLLTSSSGAEAAALAAEPGVAACLDAGSSERLAEAVRGALDGAARAERSTAPARGALGLSPGELERVIQAMSGALLLYDPQGQLLGMNPAALRLHGFASLPEARRLLAADPAPIAFSDLRGMPLPAEAWPLARALGGETFSDLLVRARRVDTGAEWVASYHGVPVRNAAGDVDLVLLLIHDAAERARAEQALQRANQELQIQREELEVATEELGTQTEELLRAQQGLREGEARLRAILEALPASVLVAGADGRLLSANPAAREMWGEGQLVVGSDHCRRQGWWPDGRPVRRAEWALARALASGEVVAGEQLEIPARDGGRRTILIYARPIRDERDQISGAVAVHVDITDRAHAEAQVASVALFPDENPQPILRVAGDGTLLYANRASDALLTAWGARVGEVLAERWAGAITSELAQGASRRMEAAAGGTDYDLLVVPLPAQGYVNVYASDVTARRAAQHALQRRLAELEALYEAAGALQESLDRREVLQRLCDLAVARFGLRMAWVGLADGEDAGSGGLVSIAMAGTDADETEVVQGRIRQDGRERPALLALRTGRPVVATDLSTDARFDPTWRAQALSTGHRAVAAFPLSRHGHTIGVLVVYCGDAEAFGEESLRSLRSLAYLAAEAVEKARLFEQVREHAAELEERVAERTAALRESEARFRAIFEGAAAGVLLLDREGRIQAANPAMEQLLGYSAAEMQERTFTEWLAPSLDAAALLGEYRAYVGGREAAPEQTEVRFQRRGGQLRWGEVTLTAVRDAEGTAQFAIVMLEDITEERGARAALIRSERLQVVSQLSAALAHEIKNPLQGVVGVLDLLREALGEDEAARRYLDAASDALGRIDRVVSRLRALHQQRDPDTRTPTDLRGLVEQTLLLTERQRMSLGVQTVVEIPEDLPELDVVADQIAQALLNLVLNAYEAMPRGGTLTLRAHATADPAGVVLEVADTGVGMPPEALPRVYEFMYTTKEQGTGLGLFITRDIVQSHGGRIVLESEEGVGTTFRVWLPATGKR